MSREFPRPPKSGYQRIRMVVAYDGTDYYGWQRLGHVSPTIQEVIEEQISIIFDEPIAVVASGRTDAGVHALAQQAHFDVRPDPKRLARLHHALRRRLPKSIVVRGLWLAPPNFHAIWSVEKKTYVYRIETTPHPSVFTYRHAWWLHYPLKFDLLQQHADFLLGNQDFKSFMTGGSPVKSTIREIYSAQWKEVKPGKLTFTITGSGFLKQMVRNIVGTIVDLNKLGLPPKAMKEILEARDRQKALTTAPAQGLSLSKVFYPRDLDIQCRKI